MPYAPKVRIIHSSHNLSVVVATDDNGAIVAEIMVFGTVRDGWVLQPSNGGPLGSRWRAHHHTRDFAEQEAKRYLEGELSQVASAPREPMGHYD